MQSAGLGEKDVHDLPTAKCFDGPVEAVRSFRQNRSSYHISGAIEFTTIYDRQARKFRIFLGCSFGMMTRVFRFIGSAHHVQVVRHSRAFGSDDTFGPLLLVHQGSLRSVVRNG